MDESLDDVVGQSRYESDEEFSHERRYRRAGYVLFIGGVSAAVHGLIAREHDLCAVGTFAAIAGVLGVSYKS